MASNAPSPARRTLEQGRCQRPLGEVCWARRVRVQVFLRGRQGSLQDILGEQQFQQLQQQLEEIQAVWGELELIPARRLLAACKYKPAPSNSEEGLMSVHIEDD